MSKPNSLYIGCPLIPENHEYSVNEKSVVVYFNCKKPYKVHYIGCHFKNSKKALKHKGKDPKNKK